MYIDNDNIEQIMRRKLISFLTQHVCIPHEKLEEDLVVIDYLFPSDQDCDRLAKDALTAEVKETQERYSTLL